MDGNPGAEVGSAAEAAPNGEKTAATIGRRQSVTAVHGAAAVTDEATVGTVTDDAVEATRTSQRPSQPKGVMSIGIHLDVK